MSYDDRTLSPSAGQDSYNTTRGHAPTPGPQAAFNPGRALFAAMRSDLAQELKGLVMDLVKNTDNKTGLCRRPGRWLAKACDLSPTTLDKRVDALVALGVLHVTRGKRADGKNAPNVYRLDVEGLERRDTRHTPKPVPQNLDAATTDMPQNLDALAPESEHGVHQNLDTYLSLSSDRPSNQEREPAAPPATLEVEKPKARDRQSTRALVGSLTAKAEAMWCEAWAKRYGRRYSIPSEARSKLKTTVVDAIGEADARIAELQQATPTPETIPTVETLALEVLGAWFTGYLKDKGLWDKATGKGRLETMQHPLQCIGNGRHTYKLPWDVVQKPSRPAELENPFSAPHGATPAAPPAGYQPRRARPANASPATAGNVGDMVAERAKSFTVDPATTPTRPVRRDSVFDALNRSESRMTSSEALAGLRAFEAASTTTSEAAPMKIAS